MFALEAIACNCDDPVRASSGGEKFLRIVVVVWTTVPFRVVDGNQVVDSVSFESQLVSCGTSKIVDMCLLVVYSGSNVNCVCQTLFGLFELLEGSFDVWVSFRIDDQV